MFLTTSNVPRADKCSPYYNCGRLANKNPRRPEGPCAIPHPYKDLDLIRVHPVSSAVGTPLGHWTRVSIPAAVRRAHPKAAIGGELSSEWRAIVEAWRAHL